MIHSRCPSVGSDDCRCRWGPYRRCARLPGDPRPVDGRWAPRAAAFAMGAQPGPVPESIGGGRSVADRPRRPALTDVARIAGVSHQTVSRVLNDSPKVRKETRARVLEAIESLGYRRNAAARALATNRTQVVGVLMLTAGEPRFGPTSTLLAVVDAARESGHMAMLAVARESSDVVVSEMLGRFFDQAVEGVVVVSPQAEAVAAARTLSTSVPVIVVASGEQPRPNFQVASVDQQLGAVLATRHLLELGHRDVVHISGPPDWLDAVQRVQGWRAERARWGLARRGAHHG